MDTAEPGTFLHRCSQAKLPTEEEIIRLQFVLERYVRTGAAHTPAEAEFLGWPSHCAAMVVSEEEFELAQSLLVAGIERADEESLIATAIWSLGKSFQARHRELYVKVLRTHLDSDGTALYQALIALDNLGAWDGADACISAHDTEGNRKLAREYLGRADAEPGPPDPDWTRTERHSIEWGDDSMEIAVDAFAEILEQLKRRGVVDQDNNRLDGLGEDSEFRLVTESDESSPRTFDIFRRVVPLTEPEFQALGPSADLPGSWLRMQSPALRERLAVVCQKIEETLPDLGTSVRGGHLWFEGPRAGCRLTTSSAGTAFLVFEDREGLEAHARLLGEGRLGILKIPDTSEIQDDVLSALLAAASRRTK